MSDSTFRFLAGIVSFWVGYGLATLFLLINDVGGDLRIAASLIAGFIWQFELSRD